MEIGALPSVQGINGNPVSNGEVSEETFLQLLSAQLQHQDPLEPASDVEFIQQMATFASLEQQRITNSNLNVIQLYQSSLNNSNALNIVGKDVKIVDSELNHESGQSHQIYYEGDSEAAKVKISIFDSKHREVFSQTQIGSTDDEQEFTWHGNDNDGNPVSDGEYTIRVTLENQEGASFSSPVYQSQRVQGIAYENGSIMLLIGDKKIPIENVIEVYEAGALGGSGEVAFKNKSLFEPYQPFRVIAGGS